jgi:hypothetical protein
MRATELAGAIRHRQVSGREVVQALLQRVEAVNTGVNAITVLLADEALAAAAAANRLVAAGGDLAPLLGVPPRSRATSIWSALLPPRWRRAGRGLPHSAKGERLDSSWTQ